MAALLALARQFRDKPQQRTVRFVFFVNEEPPFFWTRDMGSLRYARRCRERNERIFAMLSLETIGYYRDEPGTQKYPPFLDKLYPSEGNFISFVGNTSSAWLVRRVTGAFRRGVAFPAIGGSTSERIPQVGWSDHWSFWRAGYSALMVTDTAPFRYPYYHTAQDTEDKLNYERMARVVEGLVQVVVDLAK